MNLFVAILLAGAAQGFFVSAILLARSSLRSVANTFLAALVAACAVTNLDDFATQAGLLARHPSLSGLSLIVLPLIGPLLLFHVDALTTRGTWQLTRRHLRHLVPPVLCWLALIPLLTLPAPTRFDVLTDRLPSPPIAAAVSLMWIYLTTSVQIGIALVSAFRLLRRRQAELDPATASRAAWIRLFLWVAAACWLAYSLTILGSVLKPAAAGRINDWASLLQVIGLYALGFLGLTRPDTVLQPLQVNPATSPEPPKYSRSALRQTDAERIFLKAEQALAQSDLIIEASLSLPKLGAAIGASTNDLSQAINLIAGCNFYAFVNRFRVERAKRLLADASNDDSILDVAFAVGFNSKSVFNSAFKRFTGVTPSEWRRTAPSARPSL